MKYIIKCMDSFYGPFPTAGKAAEWAMENLPRSYTEKGFWHVHELSEPFKRY